MKLSEAVREAVDLTGTPKAVPSVFVKFDKEYQRAYRRRMIALEYVLRGRLEQAALNHGDAPRGDLPVLHEITEWNDETRAELLARADILEEAGV